MASSWASGISVYGVTAIVGIAGRLDWIDAPAFVERGWVIAVALVLFVVEFVIDKVALIDSVWDGLHTVIRPAIGGYLASSATDTALSVAALAATGVALALSSHSAKTSTRVIINASPEPFSNVAVSLGEDGLVAVLMACALTRPQLALTLTAVLAVLSTIVAVVLFRTARRITRRVRSSRATPPNA